jgi:hypothetical protein
MGVMIKLCDADKNMSAVGCSMRSTCSTRSVEQVQGVDYQ